MCPVDRNPVDRNLIALSIFGQQETGILLILRDGPLEKLWGGGGILSQRNFFSLSNSLYEFCLGRSMNIFSVRVNWRA